MQNLIYQKETIKYVITYQDFTTILNQIKNQTQNITQFKYALYYYFKLLNKKVNYYQVINYYQVTNYYTLKQDYLFLNLNNNNNKEIWQVINFLTKKFYLNNNN